jgi:branched-chain amino acid aminotransferase
MTNLNGQRYNNLPEQLLSIQRAAYYGDGIFETIRSFEGQMPFWELHWGRLIKGAKALELDWPEEWTSTKMAQEIVKTGIHNSRIRLMVWRNPGGLFRPENDQPQFQITVQPLDSTAYEWHEEGISACFCHSVKLPMDELSGIKLLGGNRYVKAAMEVQKRGMQDGLIFNSENRICEATSSNVFWIKNGTLFYPEAGEGQVAGTTQACIIALSTSLGWPVKAVLGKREALMNADEIFLTNAIQGIRWIRQLEGKTYNFSITRQLFENYAKRLSLKHLN